MVDPSKETRRVKIKQTHFGLETVQKAGFELAVVRATQLLSRHHPRPVHWKELILIDSIHLTVSLI